MFTLWKSSERYQCVHDKGALYKHAKRSHLKSNFFSYLYSIILYWEFKILLYQYNSGFFLNEYMENRILFFVE